MSESTGPDAETTYARGSIARDATNRVRQVMSTSTAIREWYLRLPSHLIEHLASYPNFRFGFDDFVAFPDNDRVVGVFRAVYPEPMSQLFACPTVAIGALPVAFAYGPGGGWVFGECGSVAMDAATIAIGNDTFVEEYVLLHLNALLACVLEHVPAPVPASTVEPEGVPI